MVLEGVLQGDLGHTIWNFSSDEIENESTTVWEGITFNPEEPDDEDQHWPIRINQYEGVFYVWALEHGDTGYFLSLEDAVSYVDLNWLGQVKDLE